MIKALNLEGFRGAKGRTRCFPHILNLSVKVQHRVYPSIFLILISAKAVLSQFSSKLEDDKAQPALAERPAAERQARVRGTAPLGPIRAPTRQARRAASDSSDSDSNDSDSGDDDDCPPHSSGNNDGDIDMPDQDEDVIRAAEAAQQADLDEAEQAAELELAVTDGEQKIASTALAKVSAAVIVCQ